MRSSCCCSSIVWRLDGSSVGRRYTRSCSRRHDQRVQESRILSISHNCPYEGVWKDNRRRFTERTPLWDVLATNMATTISSVLVGDASMSPTRIFDPGGSGRHFNEESGAVCMHRLTTTYPAAIWLNPVPEQQWGYSQSVSIIRELMNDRGCTR